MARRNSAIPRFSLFSFQDIITCTTSIFLLITILLALDLAQQTEKSPQVQAPQVVQELAREQKQLDGQLADLEAEIRSQTEMLNSGLLIDVAVMQSHVEDSDNRAQQLTREQQRLAVLETRATDQQRELQQRQEQRAPEKDEIKQLQERLNEAQKQVAEMKSINRVFYNVTVGSGRTPWLIEMGHQRIVVAQAGVQGTPQIFNATGPFLAWANQQSPTQLHLIVLLKPDAVADYDAVIEKLRGKGFTIGLDVLKVDQQAIDPVKGAG